MCASIIKVKILIRNIKVKFSWYSVWECQFEGVLISQGGEHKYLILILTKEVLCKEVGFLIF